MNKFLVLVVGLFLLSACDSLHYEDGKSSSDIPVNVNTVYLKNVYMVARWKSTDKNAAGVKNDPAQEEDPSKNDQEVVALVKSTAIGRLSSRGYTIVENNETPSPIMMKFFVDYQPETWPVAGRTLLITSRVYALDGTPLFSITEHDQNALGLVGAAFGDSRDEMVVSLTQKVVDETIQEIHKGKQHLASMPTDINR